MLDPSRNILLTGIPRSGTTLMTALVDAIPNAVALNEPPWQREIMARCSSVLSKEEYVKWLIGDFHDLRFKLQNEIPIMERRLSNGAAVTNYYRKRAEDRPEGEVFQLIEFTRAGLQPDFLFAVKHNGPYLSVLKQLADSGCFTIIAIVRNPIGAISSWRDVPIPLGQGRMPGATGYWKEMDTLTGSAIDLLEKQVRMYDLICRRLYRLREKVHILKYEELVENLDLLGAILGRDVSFFRPRIKKRELSFYGDTTPIADAIRQFGEHYRHFYPEI